MSVCVYLFIYIYVCVSIHLSVYPVSIFNLSVHIFIHLSIHYLFIDLSFHIFIHLSMVSTLPLLPYSLFSFLCIVFHFLLSPCPILNITNTWENEITRQLIWNVTLALTHDSASHSQHPKFSHFLSRVILIEWKLLIVSLLLFVLFVNFFFVLRRIVNICFAFVFAIVIF